MKDIFELSYEFAQLQTMAENGDVSAEEFAEAMAALQYDLSFAADGYARMIRNLEAEAEGFKKAAEDMTAKQRLLTARIARIKVSLADLMRMADTRKVKTELFDIRLQANGGKLPVVLDCAPDQLPDDLVRFTRVPDNDKIAKYINDTGDVSYAHFGERGESVRIR